MARLATVIAVLSQSLLVCACSAQSGSTQAQTTAHAAPSPAVSTSNPAVSANVQVPTSGQVLQAIYGKNSHGTSSYAIDQGRWATYWYGYAFMLNGSAYFTGFAYNTAPTSSDDNDMPGPDSKVTITEATFQKINAGAANPWSLLGVQRDDGQFGGNAKGNEVDTSQPPPNYKTAAGKLVLAIPGWYLASGSRVRSYEVFAFDPHLTGPDAARWTYLGNLAAGEDNGAACGEATGSSVPCAKSTGLLNFVPDQGKDMPRIRISWAGTQIDAAGHVQQLAPNKANDYSYSSSSKTYVSAKP